MDHGRAIMWNILNSDVPLEKPERVHKTLDAIEAALGVEKITIVPSARIDYCCECKKDHGYDCPKDKFIPMLPPMYTAHEQFGMRERQKINSLIAYLQHYAPLLEELATRK